MRLLLTTVCFLVIFSVFIFPFVYSSNKVHDAPYCTPSFRQNQKCGNNRQHFISRWTRNKNHLQTLEQLSLSQKQLLTTFFGCLPYLSPTTQHTPAKQSCTSSPPVTHSASPNLRKQQSRYRKSRPTATRDGARVTHVYTHRRKNPHFLTPHTTPSSSTRAKRHA